MQVSLSQLTDVASICGFANYIALSLTSLWCTHDATNDGSSAANRFTYFSFPLARHWNTSVLNSFGISPNDFRRLKPLKKDTKSSRQAPTSVPTRASESTVVHAAEVMSLRERLQRSKQLLTWKPALGIDGTLATVTCRNSVREKQRGIYPSIIRHLRAIISAFKIKLCWWQRSPQ